MASKDKVEESSKNVRRYEFDAQIHENIHQRIMYCTGVL